ncbi:MAG: DUF5686 and carboxypeptidase regulatory-like domain-containing protein [Paludibacteraceae bacterium]|nr:DUF5686 and carboxypeptidase regulatory-like domain-containing protein [Paludibacteraceae bacterium]
MKRYGIILVLLVLPFCRVAGQLSTLVGQIYDAQTGEPLPNISIYIPGTQVGTATNEEGYFLFRTELKKKARLTISGIGYRTEHLTLAPGQSAGIDIAMQEQSTSLTDVFISPGENPALPLLERVRKARRANDVATGEADRASTDLYVSRITATHLKRFLWRNLKEGMTITDDSTYLLPLYHRTNINGQVSSQALLLSETDYDILLDDLNKAVDFYRNSIPVYSTSFLSPLASDGNNFYTYYLADSATTSHAKTYTVHFRTKNPYYNTFDGQMVIDSASAALISITATVPRQVNANYLHQLTITQSYDSLSHRLQDEQITMLLDFAIKADTSHTFPAVLIKNVRQYTSSPAVSSASVFAPNDSVLLSDTLNTTSPLIRTAKWLAYIIQNAYMPTGTKIEIGNLSELIHINPQERVRIGLPLRTSPKLWKNVCLEAYAACGIGDHAWKGAGTVYWNMPTLRRNMLQIRYADEYIYSEISDFDRLMRENAVWSPQMGITTAMVKSLYNGSHTYNSMSRMREGKLVWDSDWSDKLETRVTLSLGRLGYGEPTHYYGAQPSFFFTKLHTVFRLSWEERKIDVFCRRIHVHNHLPVLFLGAEMGSYRLDGRDQYDVYGKLNVMLRQTLPLGAGGELQYMFEAGLVLGAVPFPLLNIFDGNQSYAYDPYRFTLMHNYQFAADRYLLLHTEWNGQGCLFNLIPGVQVLRLRELASFKIAYGGLGNRHDERLAMPQGWLRDLNTPYVEVGVGLGNILRVADLMSVWRLTHRDEPGAPNWSLRFRFHIDT